MTRISPWVIGLTGALLAASCGGGGGGGGGGTGGTTTTNPPPTVSQYKVGGTVSGLADGATLVVENQGQENLKISANGAFSFATMLSSGAAYSVHVATQPAAPDEYCSVANGDGTTGSADISNITVACTTTIGPDSAANVVNVGNHSVETLLQLASFVGERLTYLSGHLGSTATEACPAYAGSNNGSVTYTFTDTDASGSLTSGDTVVIVATKCASPSLADYATGTLTVTLVAPLTANAWSANATASALQLSDRTIDGRLDLDYISQETAQTVRVRAGASPALQITYSVGGDVITFDDADSSKTIDYTIPQYSVELAASFQSKSLLGPYVIRTPVPFQGRLGIFPVSGQEKISAGPSVLQYAAQDSSDNNYVQAGLDATGSGTFQDLGENNLFWGQSTNGFLWYEPRGLNYVQYAATPGYQTGRRDEWQMRLMFTEPAQTDPINEILSTGMDATTPIKLFFSGPVDPSTLSLDFEPQYTGNSLSAIPAVTSAAGPIVSLHGQTQLQHGQTYTLKALSLVQSTWQNPASVGADVRLDLTTLNNLQADAGPSPAVAAPGQTVSLFSNRSFSTDSNIAHYAWSQTGGPAVTLNGAAAATATFVVPAGVQNGAALHFNLTITDGKGSTDSAPVTVFVLTDLTQPFLYYRQQQAAAVGQSDELAVLESPASGTTRTELDALGGPDDLFRFFYSATNNTRPPSDDLEFTTPGHTIVPNAYTSANTPGGRPFFLMSLPFQCYDAAWTFTVFESVSAGDGTAAKFAADFTQTCPGNLPPYTGSIRVNSTVPLP